MTRMTRGTSTSTSSIRLPVVALYGSVLIVGCAADDLCLQLSLLGLSKSTCLFHSLRPLAHPSVTPLTLWTFKVLSVAVQV
jgi:hypothetical protein